MQKVDKRWIEQRTTAIIIDDFGELYEVTLDKVFDIKSIRHCKPLKDMHIDEIHDYMRQQKPFPLYSEKEILREIARKEKIIDEIKHKIACEN